MVCRKLRTFSVLGPSEAAIAPAERVKLLIALCHFTSDVSLLD